ncbi:MAG: hypothetical protein J7L42_05885 [Elusimicrobia bacterium]|nr:hypothetical protein [Elusimicrobiota bacterium]
MNKSLIDFLILHSAYAYIFISLFIILAGFFLPFPEELLLLIAGFLTVETYLNPYVMLFFLIVSVFVSDLAPYLIGYFYGNRVFSIKHFQIFLNKKRVRKIVRYTGIFGFKKILIIRPFLLGIRPFTMLFFGSLRLRFASIFIYLIAGELCGILFWFFMGRIFAPFIETVVVFLYSLKELVFLFSFLLVLFIAFVKFVLKKKISPGYILKVVSFVLVSVFLILTGYEIFSYRKKLYSFFRTKIDSKKLYNKK